ncbi:MAG: Ppx/GppA phosphatase family protein [Bdellovibrionota bacterium]
MKVAALDLGSNTFLCLIAEVSKNKIIKTHSDTVEIVRLGQGLEVTKKFHPEALKRAELCLEKFSKIIAEHKPEKILAMATSAARDALNKEELFAIARKFNIPIEIIAGEKEAAITYQGAVSGFTIQNKNLMVVDIGGGSTEFIFGQDQTLIQGESANIGCVRLTEKFITSQPTAAAEILKITEYIDESIKKTKRTLPDSFSPEQIIAVAGTPTSLAAAELGSFDVSKIDGYILNQQSLERWLDKLQKATIEEKINMGIPAGRADVILIGVIILLRTMDIFGLKQIVVSTRGVRYGIALELAQ